MSIIQFPGSSISFLQIYERFAAALEARGLIPPQEIIGDGKIHRCDVRGKGGKNDGSYLLFTTGKVPAGGFQNFKDGLGWENWSFDLGRQSLTPQEQRELQQKRVAAARERGAQEMIDAAAAGQRARFIWSRAREARSNAYLERKRVAAHGARSVHAALVVPARTIDGDLRALQFISADGKKVWMKGSRPTDCFHQIGGASNITDDKSADFHPDTIVIAEGFATAASIHTATGHVTLAAFTCSNLKRVAGVLRQNYPDAQIIIAADDDRGTKGNPGIHYALEAAIAVDAFIAAPNLNGNLADGLSDFNDIALTIGVDAVLEAFKSPSNPAQFLELRLVSDPFSAFEPNNIKALGALKERDRAAFERVRGALKEGPARITELDKLWGDATEAVDQTEKCDRKQADVLVRLSNSAKLFHSRDGIAYADITRDGHRETCAIQGRDFKRWLRHAFYQETNSSPGSETFNSALGTIEAKAIFEGPEQQVHLRIAGYEGNIYIDIGDTDWRVIQVSPSGWDIISNPPVRFRRSGTLLPLPIPVTGGSISELRPFVNVPSDDEFILTVAFLLAALCPDGPYPILSLHGPAGTAKSTFSKVIRRLVDSGKPALRSLPKEKEDFFITANNNHVLAFENISSIPTWLSDLMCQVSTGGSHSRREPYTAMDETVFDAQRPQVLNGIEDFVIRGDLADRALPLVLQPIPETKRRDEKEFWRAFEAAASRVLGALLDALANGLRNFPNTELLAKPRMADFAIWATACETGSPWVKGRNFNDAYAENRAEAVAVVLEDDRVAQALRAFMAERQEWEGPASVLLARLNETWSGRDLPEKWPKAPHTLSNRIRRLVPQLASIGIAIAFSKTSDRNHARMVKVVKTNLQAEGGHLPSAQIPQDSASEASEASDDSGYQEFSSSSGAPGEVSEACHRASKHSISGNQTLYSGDRTLALAGGFGNQSNEINASDARTLSDAFGGTARNRGCGGIVCAQCGAGPETDPPGDPPTLEEAPGIWLHRECVRFWHRDPFIISLPQKTTE
jgi:phage/plasmid primase-like uncharacterized protein